ncbi:MAG: hypothetical protein KDC34_13925 [Saprospiraceae bacterium]|nr:hypothetical protein [Saprospiraceae bacterium]
MTTTKNRNYSPSVNIKRDLRKTLSYIPTPNSKGVAESLLNGLKSGSRSFVIVGAYGSGKSIFLWAFAKTLGQSSSFFNVPEEIEASKFHVVNIVGEYRSMMEAFAEEFQPGEEYDTDSILDAIHDSYEAQRENGKGLLIILDEFGKFLEYAAKFDPEEELYFIQELAEYINDYELDILFVSTLHQNFGAYGFQLKKEQQNEWTKVQGRFKEITFNEPVEQLLFLASERLDLGDRLKPKGFVPLFKSIKRSKSFPLRDYLTEDIAQKLLPLDILSAGVLTLALQRYGQNERSLFSFLESDDQLGINKELESAFYNLADVYDYLKYSFSIINTKHNPHYVQWASMASTLERAEGVFDEDYTDACALIKTIGLLNTFGAGGMIIDDQFFFEYGKRALGIKKPQGVLKQLVNHRLIRYTKYNRKYVLFEGTDLDIELAIDEAGNLVEKVGNIVDPLKEYFEFQVVLAKSVYYQKGTPRFFEYVISEELKEHYASGEIDGYINLIFNEEISIDNLKGWAAKDNRPILYCLYENTAEIHKLLFEIRKVEKVIESNQEDRIAVRELKNILEHQKRLLNHYVLDTFNNDSSSVRWVDYEGEHNIENERMLNQRLSAICNHVYHETPIFSSELINKTKLSGAIRTAQRNFIKHMIEFHSDPNWNFDPNLFPPEKSIFFSLVKDKGLIGQDDNEHVEFQQPTDESFSSLWDKSLAFLESTKSGKRSLREFIEILNQQPLKLKYGFSQFWVPLFLFAKRNDYALFEGEAYIPTITSDTLQIVLKYPHKYYIKAFLVEGVDLKLFKLYRKFLNQSERLPTNESFIETIRPFLSFLKKLTKYSRSTNRISAKAQKVRSAITKAKDPEALFFKDLPLAMGTSKRELLSNKEKAAEYIQQLEDIIIEIRTSFDSLIQRYLDKIHELTGYENLREELIARYSSLNVALMSPKQRVFFNRLVSDLDQNSWLSSLCQGLIGKTLENIEDEDEAKLYQSFSLMLEELDNLYDISIIAPERENDNEIMLVDIQTIDQGRKRKVIQFSKEKQRKAIDLKAKLLGSLSDEKAVSIAVIAEILKDLMDE